MMIRRLDYGGTVEKRIGNPKSLQLRNLMVAGRSNLSPNCANLQQRSQFQFILIKTSTQLPKPIGIVLHLSWRYMLENISRIYKIQTPIIPTRNTFGRKNLLPGGRLCTKHVMTKSLATKSSGKVIISGETGKPVHFILIYMLWMGRTPWMIGIWNIQYLILSNIITAPTQT